MIEAVLPAEWCDTLPTWGQTWTKSFEQESNWIRIRVNYLQPLHTPPRLPGVRGLWMCNFQTLRLDPYGPNQEMDEYEDTDTFADAVGDPASEDDALFNHPNNSDWAEHDHHFDRRGQVQYLLSKIWRELDDTQKEECLNFVVDDPLTKNEFLQLSNFFPSSPLSTQLNPIFTGITNIQKLIENFSEKIDKLTPNLEPHPDKTINGSIHAPNGTNPTWHNQQTPRQRQPPPQNLPWRRCYNLVDLCNKGRVSRPFVSFL